MATQEQPPVQTSETDHLGDPISDLASQYGKQAGIGAVVLLVCVGLYSFVTDRNQSESESVWSRFAQADDAGEFATVADDFPDHPAGAWARLREGEEYLQAGVRLQTTDRKGADGELKKAAEAFEALSKMTNVPAEVRVRAELCSAWLLEAQCDGDTEAVINAYKGFQKNNPESVHKDYVDARIKALESDDSKAFYAWFSELNPKPEDTLPMGSQFGSGLPDGHPELPVTFPQIPEDLYPADWNELETNELPELGGDEQPTGANEGETTDNSTEDSKSSEGEDDKSSETN